MNKRQVIITGLSIAFLAIAVFFIVFGCSTCSQINERNRLATLAAEKQAEDETARLEAQRQADDEAARLEAQKQADDEAARLAAQKQALQSEAARLAAERQALAAQRAAQQSAAAKQPAATAQQSAPAKPDANNPLIGTWANSTKTVIIRFRPDGNIDILHFLIVDEYVEVYWRTNWGIAGGGFNDTRNPVPVELVYTGKGIYTVNKDTVTFKLNLSNQKGDKKNISHTTKFIMRGQKDSFKLVKGLARRYIINRDNNEVYNTKDYVTEFFRQ
ncbi:MAG: hypothetical protein FWF29_11955 [Treponema sp.]|nr:hypothetical protein [Treponema sp.]